MATTPSVIARLLLSGKDLGRLAKSEEEIIATISKYNAALCIANFSHINLVLSRGGLDSFEFHQFLTKRFFDEAIVERLLFEIHKQKEEFTIFFPGVFRILIKLLLKYGQREGGADLSSPNDFYTFGELILAIPDTFRISPSENEPDDALDKLIYFTLEIERHGYMPSSPVGRVLPVKEAILADVLSTGDNLNAFKAVHKMLPSELLSCVITLKTMFGQVTPVYAKNFPPLILDVYEVFGSAKIPRRIGDYFLKKYVHSFDSLSDYQLNDRQPARDIGVLAERPFFEVSPGRLVCLDWEFTESLNARILFKATEDALNQSGLGNLKELAGNAFEKLVTTTLNSLSAARPKAKFVPMTKNAAIEHDGLFYEEGGLLVIEAKSGLITLGARLSENCQETKRQLWKKFIFGPSEKVQKGMRQLATRIPRIASNYKAYGLPKPTYIVPVLVVEDEFVSNGLVAEYCIQKSSDLFHSAPKGFKRPVIIHVMDLYLLRRRTHLISPIDAIIRYSESRASAQMISFGSWIIRQFPIEEKNEVDELERQLLKFSLPAYEDLLRLPDENQNTICEDCNMQMGYSSFKPERPVWICPSCGNARPALPHEVDLSIRRKIANVNSYLSS